MRSSEKLPYILIFLITGGIAAMHGWAAIHGLQAPACPGSPDCYPWDAEGPTAGVWRYESKENYALVCFAQMAIIIVLGLLIVWHAFREFRNVYLRIVIWLLIAMWGGLFLI